MDGGVRGKMEHGRVSYERIKINSNLRSFRREPQNVGEIKFEAMCDKFADEITLLVELRHWDEFKSDFVKVFKVLVEEFRELVRTS